ncbi:ATP-grasp ribosomal peptide maturase [Kribbella sp. VKM Ac-2527]|uniref:ATP-grasp ribosomal peptide maturase n=1 Tax=Kribbella caucasensis TaxID=2512215 RepID=A0A4V3CB84_9ACTN|nr:ATP-grasp ribosomal peptide maturase [Kribbella sp. VKM Ac-2527]TDO54960.1 ATP-grasp ribosomal peptide maturase [Kribbella sp. VKM Ac-2527]
MLRDCVLVVTGEDTTADLVIDELNQRGVPVVRFDLADFPNALATTARYGEGAFAGSLWTESRAADLSAVRSIYYRRPTQPTFAGLAAQDARFSRDQARFGLGGVLSALPGCRQVNHPRRQMAAEYKPAQLTVATELGFAVPPTIVTNRLDDARQFVEEHGIAVYKPLWSTEYEEDGEARAIWVRAVSTDELDESVGGTAHLFQARVDKSADVRVTVVGDRSFCVRIDSPLTDWRERYDLIRSYTVVEPPAGLNVLLTKYLERFGLSYGCFDFGIDALDGTWWWFECNPGGEWGWIESETGLPIARAFADLLAD